MISLDILQQGHWVLISIVERRTRDHDPSAASIPTEHVLLFVWFDKDPSL